MMYGKYNTTGFIEETKLSVRSSFFLDRHQQKNCLLLVTML